MALTAPSNFWLYDETYQSGFQQKVVCIHGAFEYEHYIHFDSGKVLYKLEINNYN